MVRKARNEGRECRIRLLVICWFDNYPAIQELDCVEDM
jgi:hypothetical protein